MNGFNILRPPRVRSVFPAVRIVFLLTPAIRNWPAVPPGPIEYTTRQCITAGRRVRRLRSASSKHDMFPMMIEWTVSREVPNGIQMMPGAGGPGAHTKKQAEELQ